MSKKRAFVRYTKKGEIVPGSLILTDGTYPDKPALWKEITVNHDNNNESGCQGCDTTFILPCFQELFNGTYDSLFQNFSYQGYGQLSIYNLSSAGSSGLNVSTELLCQQGTYPQRKFSTGTIFDVVPPQDLLVDNNSLYNITLPFLINTFNNLPHNTGHIYLYGLEQVIIPTLIVETNLNGGQVTLTNVFGASIKVKSKVICQVDCANKVDAGYLKLFAGNIVPALPNPNN